MTTRAPESEQSSMQEAAARASAVAGSARDEARAVAETAGSETRRLLSEAGRELRDQSETQARRVADGLRDLGHQAQRLLDGEGGADGPGADVVREVAQRADALAARLDDGGVDRVRTDLKQFARRRPGLFLAGAFTVGIVAGRVLRNVDTHRLVDAARPDGDAGADALTGPDASTGTFGASAPAMPPPSPAVDDPTELTTPTAAI